MAVGFNGGANASQEEHQNTFSWSYFFQAVIVALYGDCERRTLM